MFTGIVEAMGVLRDLKPQPGGKRLIVDRNGWAHPVKHGDSVAVSGVCLTVVEHDDETIAFDVITETLSKTSLGDVAVGGHINLEPSLAAGAPMGGHFVQGHVDGVGVVTNVQTGEDYRITIEPPDDLREYIVPKGSVTVDGVSMTIASVDGNTFDIALIPTTLNVTTLGEAKQGTRVNLESDILARTIVHWMRQRSSSDVTVDTLRDAGFV